MTRTAPWLASLTVLAAFLAVGWGGTVDAGHLLAALPLPDTTSLDVPSLVAGAVLGASAMAMRKVAWFELPRRISRWLAANQNNIGLGAIAVLCLGVLLFY